MYEIEFWLSLGAILVLLCLSGFFSGSETAMTATSKARMHGFEKDGNARAALVNRILEKKDRLIGALLLGNNLVNILASALATALLIKIFGETGVVYATLGMTLLVLIFAEVLPKTYALLRAEKMAMFIAPVIYVVVKLFSPISELVVRLVYFVLRRSGMDVEAEMDTNEEVLRGAIEMHEGPNQETVEQRAMLRSILDLAAVEVSDIMTHRKNLVTVDANQPVDNIVNEILDCPFTRLPVWIDDPDNIIGVVHAKLLLKELRNMSGAYQSFDITEIASDPWFIPETTTLFDQLQAFRERKEHFAIVVDEYGGLMGVVTLEDILEEIVGEIDDEHDITVEGVKAQPDGSYVIDGTVTIRDLNRELDWNLPGDEYSTLAGMILYESKMIPQVGQVFTFHDFRFKILKRQRNQITEIKVFPPEQNKTTIPEGQVETV